MNFLLQGSQFFHSFRSANRVDLEDTWDEIQRLHGSPAQGSVGQIPISELDRLNHRGASVQLQPTLDGNSSTLISSIELNMR